MRKIFLPEIDCSNYGIRYIGSRSRYATATAVAFINQNLILAASLLGKCIYLISISEDTYEIIDTIKTNTLPDLMDYKNNLIVTSNTESSTISLYRLKDNKISLVEDILLNNKITPHGCRLIDDNKIIITNKYKKNSGCFEYCINNKKCKKIISDNYVTKDIFIQNYFSIVVSTEFVALRKPSKPPKSIIYFYYKNKLLNYIEVDGQTEGVTCIKNDVFITDQYNSSILHYKIDDKKINFVKSIKGLDFPHGIYSLNNKIAVSNYGNNSIYIYNFDELS